MGLIRLLLKYLTTISLLPKLKNIIMIIIKGHFKDRAQITTLISQNHTIMILAQSYNRKGRIFHISFIQAILIIKITLILMLLIKLNIHFKSHNQVKKDWILITITIAQLLTPLLQQNITHRQTKIILTNLFLNRVRLMIFLGRNHSIISLPLLRKGK